MTKDETSKYTIVLRDEKTWQFVFPDRGEILHHASVAGTRADGTRILRDFRASLVGQRQHPAGRSVGRRRTKLGAGALQGPILPKAPVRFPRSVAMERRSRVLQSRATDDTDMVQPTRAQFAAERGLRGVYHYNAIASWRIDEMGEASNVYA